MTDEWPDYGTMPQRYAAALRILKPDATDEDYARLVSDGQERGNLVVAHILKAIAVNHSVSPEIQAASRVVREVEKLDNPKIVKAVDKATRAIFNAD